MDYVGRVYEHVQDNTKNNRIIITEQGPNSLRYVYVDYPLFINHGITQPVKLDVFLGWLASGLIITVRKPLPKNYERTT